RAITLLAGFSRAEFVASVAVPDARRESTEDLYQFSTTSHRNEDESSKAKLAQVLKQVNRDQTTTSFRRSLISTRRVRLSTASGEGALGDLSDEEDRETALRKSDVEIGL